MNILRLTEIVQIYCYSTEEEITLLKKKVLQKWRDFFIWIIDNSHATDMVIRHSILHLLVQEQRMPFDSFFFSSPSLSLSL